MEIPRSRKFFACKKHSTYTMPHRCVAGGCLNTAKDGVSLHGWPTNVRLTRQWTNAVRNTWANFNQTASSKLCSSHFSDDSFETQSVIAHSLGLKMKKILKPHAVPTIFNNCPPQKRQKNRKIAQIAQKGPLRRRMGLVLSSFQSSPGDPIEKEKPSGYVL